MSYRGHCGWERFPSSKMTTASRTCQCRKCTLIVVLVAGLPGHPSNGQLRGPPLAGKYMSYIRITEYGNVEEEIQKASDSVEIQEVMEVGHQTCSSRSISPTISKQVRKFFPGMGWFTGEIN